MGQYVQYGTWLIYLVTTWSGFQEGKEYVNQNIVSKINFTEREHKGRGEMQLLCVCVCVFVVGVVGVVAQKQH